MESLLRKIVFEKLTSQVSERGVLADDFKTKFMWSEEQFDQEFLWIVVSKLTPWHLESKFCWSFASKKNINFCELRNFGCCTQNLFPRSQTKILARFFIFRKILNLHFFDVWKRFWSCYENLNLEILKDFWANWSFWQPLPICSVFPAVSRDSVTALLKTDFFEMRGTFWVESSIKKSKK